MNLGRPSHTHTLTIYIITTLQRLRVPTHNYPHSHIYASMGSPDKQAPNSSTGKPHRAIVLPDSPCLYCEPEPQHPHNFQRVWGADHFCRAENYSTKPCMITFPNSSMQAGQRCSFHSINCIGWMSNASITFRVIQNFIRWILFEAGKRFCATHCSPLRFWPKQWIRLVMSIHEIIFYASN